MTLAPGAKLGFYEILSRIGAGGMGEVYKATDTRVGRTVALKVLPEEFFEDSERRARFEREARTLASLKHPGIAVLYSFEEIPGPSPSSSRHLLVMELVEGQTLAERLLNGPLPPDRVARIGIEIASALDAAHRQGIVHRDLKPGNVMLARSGVKLLDFGLAKVLDTEGPAEGLSSIPTAAKDITREGTILGTLPYMAPEQLEGRKADPRTDIFALGAVLYEMATGRKAFTGPTQASLVSAILRDDPLPVSQVQPMSPPALDRAVKVCLQKDPDDRWQCAADLRLELAWIARGGPGEGAVRDARLSFRPRWLVGLTTAGFLAAAIATLVALRRAAPPEAPRIRFAIHPPQSTRFVWARTENLFAVSPDGRRLALVARKPDGRDALWIRSLAEASGVPIKGTEGAASPFWSPDSGSVGFFAEGKLKKIDVSGGSPLTLCDVPPGFPKGSWGSRHSILFADGAGGALSLVEDGGGVPKIVLKPDSSRREATIDWPEFLPDGRHFLYVVRSGAETQTYVSLASLDGGTPQQVVKNCSRAQYVPAGSASRPGYLLYARDGSLMAQPFDDRKMQTVGDPVPTGLEIWQHALIGTGAFSASDNGVLSSRGSGGPTRLVWLDRAGRETGSLESPGGFDALNLSPDSRRVLVTKVNPRTGGHEIWIGDVARSVLTKLDLGEDEYLLPVWSPDGSRVALSVGSLRHPPVLSLLPLRGGRSPVEILPAGQIQSPECWSPDGRSLLYAVRSGTEVGFWVVNAEGDRKPRRLLTGAFDLTPHAQFSPDGRWIAFNLVESGRSEVYVTSFPEPGERVRISPSGGSRPRWRRDGRELFYVSGDNEMIAVPVRLTSEAQVGPPQRLFRMDPAGWRDYDVTGGGERFLVVVNVPAPDADAIAVTINWTSLLRR